MNDEHWGEPGWSPDGDVDDAGGVPASNGGLGGLAGGSGLRPITSGIRPADRPTTLSQAVAENVRLEAARVGVTQAGLARLLHTSRSAVSLRYTGRVQWRIDELERVAWYLNLPVTDLLKQPRRTGAYF